VVGQDGKSRAVTLHLGEFAGQRELAILVHALRRRVAGRRRFVSLHVLIPGDWAVARGHALRERNTANILTRPPQTAVSTHLEPREDPASFADQGLDGRPVEAGDWEAAR
jgi:divalent metal cation (Fe/Co/Zn/Cd) transporter